METKIQKSKWEKLSLFLWVTFLVLASGIFCLAYLSTKGILARPFLQDYWYAVGILDLVLTGLFITFVLTYYYELNNRKLKQRKMNANEEKTKAEAKFLDQLHAMIEENEPSSFLFGALTALETNVSKEFVEEELHKINKINNLTTKKQTS